MQVPDSRKWAADVLLEAQQVDRRLPGSRAPVLPINLAVVEKCDNP